MNIKLNLTLTNFLSFVYLIFLFQLNGFAQDPVSIKKALIAVVHLSSTADEFKFLYELEENKAVGSIKNMTKKHYDKIIILEKSEATYAKFRSNLIDLLVDQDITTVDTIMYIHGKGTNYIKGPSLCFYQDFDCTSMEEIKSDLVQTFQEINYFINGGSFPIQNKLRAIYSDACYGNSHSQTWVDIAFEVASGSIAKDSNKSIDLHSFLNSWLNNGKTFAEAIKSANGHMFSDISDFWIKNANSHKMIVGDGEITFKLP